MASPAAPISTPPPAAPAPSAPAAPAAPAGGAGTASVPAAPGTPAAGGAGAGAPPPSAGGVATPATAVANAEPKATDFPNTHDGQIEFMSARKAWLAKNKPPAAGPAEPAAQKPEPAAPAPEAKAPDAAQPPADGAQPADQPAAGDPAPPTPKQLADLMEKKPALKALFDADPEVKGQIFSMSRQLASLQPIGELFPGGVADAQYAAESASALTTLKTQAMRAVDNPEALPHLLETFDSQFAYVDDKGNPVLGADGKPSYAPDRDVFTSAIYDRVNTGLRTQYEGEISALKQKLQTQAYPNPAAKAMDERKLENLDYAMTALTVLDQLRSGEFFQSEAPALPADATPEMKAWFEQQQGELKRQRDELDAQKKGTSKEERKSAAQKFNTSVRAGYGKSVGDMIGNQIKTAVDSGVYIPEFYLQQKWVDPKSGQETNMPDLHMRIFTQFENELLKAGTRTALTIAEHELLPPNDQTKGIREQWYNGQAADLVPRLVRKEIDRISKLVKADQDKMQQQMGARRQAAAPEPATAGSSLPQGASEQQLRTQAEENARKLPEFAQASPSDKQAMIVTQLHRLKRPVR